MMIKLLISQMADTLFKATMMPPGSGWEAIPRGKKGGYRRRSKTGKGYEYWYADQQHATSGHQLGLFGGEPEHKEEPKHERERAETEHAASHLGSAAPVAAATRGERQDRGDDEGAGAAARREESGQAKPAEVAPAPAPVEEPKAPVVPQEEKPTAQVIIETLKQELEGKVLDGAAAAELSQTVDVRPWKPDPAASPAITLHADLMPAIGDEFRLPEHIKNFPTPHPLKDQEGKVVGHIDKLFSHQTEAAERILQGWESGDGVLLSDQAGLGKLQPVDTPVLTPAGWRKIGELQIGDEVIGSDGKAHTVIKIVPHGVKPIYRVNFSDHSSTEAGPEHLWTVAYKCGSRRWVELQLTTERLRTREPLEMTWPDGKKTLLDLAKTPLYLPMLSAPVEFANQEPLPLPAYLVGALIANGYLDTPTPAIISHADDWAEVSAKLIGDGAQLGAARAYPGCMKATILGAGAKIRELGLNVLSGEKFIPAIYLRASAKDRIDLLHGLMDADGSISVTRNRLTYHSISGQLTKDVRELVEGLGGIASIRAYDRTAENKPLEYQVRIRLPEWVLPFMIKRKAERYNPGRMARPRRTVGAIEYTRDAEAVCIAIDAEDHLYATEHCILTHNTNTALAAVLARGGKRNLIVVPTGGKAQLKAQWSGPTAAGLFGVQLKGVEEITPEAEGTFIISYDELTERVGTNEHTNKAVHGDVAAIHGGGWDTIVFDECQAMANMGGVRTESALRLQDKAGKVLYMSATPYTGIKNMHYLKRMGLWDETAGESFENWAIGAGAQRDKKSGQLRNPSSPLPLAALAATLHVDGKVIQRTTSLEGCNSKFDEIKIKDVPEEHYKAFDLADKILEVAANQGQLAPRFIKSAYIGWARTYWENLKAEKAIELGKAALAEGKQVAIFTSFKQGDHGFLQWIPGHLRDKAARAAERDQHGAAADYTAAADRIEDLLGEMPRMAPIVKRLTDAFGGVDKVAEIHGATSKKAADEQSAYQSGRKKVCVATVDKGGTGISLHDTSGDAPRVQINLSIPWSAIKFNQVAGRSHRLGSRSETKMHWIMGEHDSEKYTAAICAGRLKSMGSLCAGDPDQQVSAQDMATWEFGDGGGEPEDYAKAVELAAIMDEEEAEARRTGSEHMPTSTTREDTIDASEGLSEKTRDYFRMFAEQRKAGMDVMGTQRKEREEKKRKERLLESHRAAEQLRQGHGYKIEHRPDMGGFVLSNTLQSGERVPFDHNRNIKSKTVGGRYKPNLQGWLIPEENMGELARLQKVQHIDVDLRQAKEYSKEQATAREEKKAAHAQAILDAAAAVEGAKKAEGEQTKEGLNPHEAAMRDLRTMGLHAEIYHNSLGGASILLRGNTYDHKEAIKVGARGQAQFHGGEQGWIIPLTSLPAVADEVMGRKLPFDEAKKAAEAAGGGLSPLESSRGWRIRPHSEGRLGIFGNTYHQKDQIKRVPGARWDPNSKVWHIPESSLPILENIFAKSEPRLTINASVLSELF
jgi:hypothetical protein